LNQSICATLHPIRAGIQAETDANGRGKIVATINGTLGDDVLAGAIYADTINGLAGNDTLSGLDGADILDGGIGNDVLDGGKSADTLKGGTGIDHLIGGDGDDHFVVALLEPSGLDDTFEGGAGRDVLHYESLANQIGVTVSLAAGTAPGATVSSIEDIWGSWYVDSLTGDAGANQFRGFGGNDVMDGGGGDDIMEGGDGRDTLMGGDGDDRLLGDGTGELGGDDVLDGGAGDDYLAGGVGSNLLNGGDGNDTAQLISSAALTIDLVAGTINGNQLLTSIENAIGSKGDDTIIGTAGANFLSGETGNDVLRGGAGDDVLYDSSTVLTQDLLDGGDGIDTADYSRHSVGIRLDLQLGTGRDGGLKLVSIENLIGSVVSDILIGDGGSNVLYGFDGSDTLRGGGGADRLDGGRGADLVSYETETVGVIVDLSTGTVSGGGAQGDVLVSIESLTGGQGNDRLTGDAGSNTLRGGGGNDVLSGGDNYYNYDFLLGGAGDDVLSGGDGNDNLSGDAGDDLLRGGAGADALQGGDGIDTASYYDSIVGMAVDLGTTRASDADYLLSIENINGGQGDDTLNGSSSANVLAGWGGNDQLWGRAGADRLDGGIGTDTATYYWAPTGVTVDLAAGTGTGGEAQGDVLVSIEKVTGSNQGNDTLSGTAGVNTLAGWGGNDVLRGGGGADRLEGGAGTDTSSYYGATVGVTVNLAVGTGSGGDAQGDTYVAVENVNGSQGNDSLIGNAGANTLAGWGGDDVLRGSAGADRLDGGAGIDTASYYTGTIGVTVNLATGLGSGGEAQGDTFVSVENVTGSTAADEITGSALANVLNGVAGQDVLRGGGGADRFVFSAASDSAVGKADRITDFSHGQGDRIDLSAIDANTAAAGNQAFSFIGSGAFTHQAGQLRATVSGGATSIAGDLNGDGVSDFQIQLTGAIGLVAADFVL
jgi:Ca2+-binding RTX toxin-like protein